MKQLKKPNVSVKTKAIGWCLWWAQEAYKVPHLYPSATAQWKEARIKHTGKPPKGVFVPVFFSMKGVPAGHVAISAPDGSIYSTSSPHSLTPVHHKDMADLLRYYGGKLTYLGWSEDLGGVKVVAPDPKPVKPVKKSNLQIAKEVLAGKWGNGPARVIRLRKAGYNPKAVQAIVNKLV